MCHIVQAEFRRIEEEKLEELRQEEEAREEEARQEEARRAEEARLYELEPVRSNSFKLLASQLGRIMSVSLWHQRHWRTSVMRHKH